MDEENVPKSNDQALPERPLILLVEDERLLQEPLMQMVRSLGYHTVMAKDGIEGLKMARDLQPDLILTDAVMPHMDGREMCRILKSDPSTEHIKIIIATSLPTMLKQRNQAFRDFFVDGYFSKPLELQQLKEILERYLPRKS